MSRVGGQHQVRSCHAAAVGCEGGWVTCLAEAVQPAVAIVTVGVEGLVAAPVA